MLADDRHGQIANILAAEFLRQCQPQESRLIGAAAHLAQQRFPILARQAAMLEIGARPLTAVIEEPVVIVLMLQRHDLAIDELVDLAEKLGDVLGNGEVHRRVSNSVSVTLAPDAAEGTSTDYLSAASRVCRIATEPCSIIPRIAGSALSGRMSAIQTTRDLPSSSNT